jgi:hypothetical protein
MKKALLFLCALTMLITGTGGIPVKRVRLTLVNKSGMDIEVSLTGQDYEQFYYLKVPEGDRLTLSERMFTVVPDTYQVNAYFVELWDPVYGASCEDRQSIVDITHNTKIIVMECDQTPPNGGEAPQIKLGGVNRRGGGTRRR